jgi:hypothetical protein
MGLNNSTQGKRVRFFRKALKLGQAIHDCICRNTLRDDSFFLTAKQQYCPLVIKETAAVKLLLCS